MKKHELKETDTITYEQFKDALKIVNAYEKQVKEHFYSIEKDMSSTSKFAKLDSEMFLYDSRCSVRLHNLIYANRVRLDIDTSQRSIKLSDLNNLSISKFSECYGVGQQAVNELEELCTFAGIELSK